MRVKILLVSILLGAFSGCSWNGFMGDATTTANRDVVIQKVDKDDLREVMKKEKMIYNSAPEETTFRAVGEGIAPMNSVSYAQSVTLAKRAAMADAYSQLAGKLYGVKINAEDTVRDAMLNDSSITSKVQGLVKNATIVSESFKDGLYRVNMELRIDQEKWREVFSY
ncbi:MULTISPECIES: LPP20 family lipoprotein [Campylobacter]|jgi:putative lipoprotein|uniref:LPP20 family lipoprotein n=1 Tax=Campylobacter TaxID=194 RepID=UPI00027A342C|nr:MULTISPECIES: LPP20 family lipoprotein [Campylobacter]EJP76343.1 LPP20 lipoprotein [Campylobacter sp. FOBRC14]MBN7288307.1 LPP20 family lipoprotein [Campylobacter curvus]MDU6826997.1 LPP20 family lipoprotein [Campylobacter sp.]QKF61707.1 basal disk protein FlgP [Campylobacter curvus]